MSKASIPDLQKAYAVLGVGFSATSREIEQAYKRRLEQNRADTSPGMLNSAYLLVARAPLRAFATRETPLNSFDGGALVGVDFEDDRPAQPDMFEYVIRFVCGALLGTLLTGRMWMRYFLHPGWYSLWGTWLISIGSAVVLGFAAALWGDRFWYSTLGSRWFWWQNR